MPFNSVSSKIRPHIKNKNIWINPVVVAWFVRAFGVIQSSTNSGFETQRCRFSEIVWIWIHLTIVTRLLGWGPFHKRFRAGVDTAPCQILFLFLFLICCPNWTQACSHLIGYIPGTIGSLFFYSPNTYPGMAILPPIQFVDLMSNSALIFIREGNWYNCMKMYI